MEVCMLKILIVDDDPFFATQILVKALDKVLELESEEFDIMFALDGVEGLQVFEKEKPDFVITDYNMPKMTGDKLLQKISESQHQPKQSFLMSSDLGLDCNKNVRFIHKDKIFKMFFEQLKA